MTTPSVPSLPHSSDGQCRPTVSFGSPASEPISEPSASTAVSPATCDRIVPKRTTREPPALVATAPPTVAESRLAKSTGASSPAARAWRRQRGQRDAGPGRHLQGAGVDGAERGQPASSRARPSARRAARCRRRGRCCRPAATTGAPASAHARRTRGDLGGVAGRTTSSASPRKRPVQSVAYDAVTSGSASTWSGPTTSASAARQRAHAGPGAAAASAGPARPDRRRRTAGRRRARSPIGCHGETARLPIHSPTGSRCRAMTQVGVDELHLVRLGVAAEGVAAVGERADALERRRLLVRAAGRRCASTPSSRPGRCPRRAGSGSRRRRGTRAGRAPTRPIGNGAGRGVGEPRGQRRRCCRARPRTAASARRRRACRSPWPGPCRRRRRSPPACSPSPGRRARPRSRSEPGHRDRPAEVDGDAGQAQAGDGPLERPHEQRRSAARRGRRRGPTVRGRGRSGEPLAAVRPPRAGEERVRHGARPYDGGDAPRREAGRRAGRR